MRSMLPFLIVVLLMLWWWSYLLGVLGKVHAAFVGPSVPGLLASGEPGAADQAPSEGGNGRSGALSVNSLTKNLQLIREVYDPARIEQLAAGNMGATIDPSIAAQIGANQLDAQPDARPHAKSRPADRRADRVRRVAERRHRGMLRRQLRRQRHSAHHRHRG